MSTLPIDYSALAKKAGAIASQPAAVDYTALAKQAGAIESKAPAPAAPPAPHDAGVLDYLKHTFDKTARVMNVENLLGGITNIGEAVRHGDWTGAKEAIQALDPSLGDLEKDTTEKLHSGDYSGATANVLPLAATMLDPGARAVVRDGVARDLSTARAVGGKVADALPAVANKLTESAEKNINTALNPTTKVNKALVRSKIAPGLVERKVVATSLKDLQEKATAKLEEHGANIDAIFDDHADKGTKLSPQPILEALENEKQSYIVDGEKLNPAYVARLEYLQKQIANVAKANGGDIPLAALRRIRQVQDEVVKQSKGAFALPADAQSAVNAARLYGNAIRSTFAEGVPELAAENKEFNFWADTGKVVDDSLLRKTGQRKPLTQTVLENAGMVVGAKMGGPAGAFVGRKAGASLGALQHSTVWNTLSASAKSRVADLLAAGDEAGARAVVNNPASKATTGAGAAAALPVAPGAQPGASGALVQAPRSTSIPIPGVKDGAYKAQYKVRELEDLQPSHNGLTWTENAKYGLKNDRNYDDAVNQGKVVDWSTDAGFDPSFLVNDNNDALNGPVVTDAAGNVLGGNGRTMILQRVYGAKGKAAGAYRDLLEARAAQFGIDPASVQGMKRPVLVREVPDTEFSAGRTKQGAITEFNKSGTAALKPAERAISDSRRVSAETLDHIAGRLEEFGPDATIAQALEGKAGGEVLGRLVDDGVITTQERAGLVDDAGKLTKDGRSRISALIVARYFKNPEQIESIAPAVRAKVERLAAPLAQLEGLGDDWNLSPRLGEALDLLERQRASGIKNLDDFIAQDGLFGKDKQSGEAITLARSLAGKTSKELLAATRQFAGDAVQASKGDGLFGAPPDAAESFKAAFETPAVKTAEPAPAAAAPAAAAAAKPAAKPAAAAKTGKSLRELASTQGDATPAKSAAKKQGMAPGPTPKSEKPAANGPAAAEPAENLSGIFAGAGKGITEGLYSMLWAKAAKGVTTELGKPSRLLTLAKPWVESGAIKGPEDLRAFAANDYKPLKEWTDSAGPKLPPPSRGGKGGAASLGSIGKKR
jgi:ddrB-like ParB superfamily domain